MWRLANTTGALTLMGILLFATPGRLRAASEPSAKIPLPRTQLAPASPLHPPSAALQRASELFSAHCTTCHSLTRIVARLDSSAEEWGEIVYRMKAKPSAHFSEDQAKAIMDYLTWQSEQKKK